MTDGKYKHVQQTWKWTPTVLRLKLKDKGDPPTYFFVSCENLMAKPRTKKKEKKKKNSHTHQWKHNKRKKKRRKKAKNQRAQTYIYFSTKEEWNKHLYVKACLKSIGTTSTTVKRADPRANIAKSNVKAKNMTFIARFTLY